MTRPTCIFCKNKASPSRRMNQKPADYQFICHTCRKATTPDEHRCTFHNVKNKRCGHWKSYKSERCGFHNRGEYK